MKKINEQKPLSDRDVRRIVGESMKNFRRVIREELKKAEFVLKKRDK